MRLIGRARLASLSGHDRDTAKWVANWTTELRDAYWKRAADVAAQFPGVRRQGNGTFVFPVPRRQVGIQVLMAFSRGVALILAVEGLEANDGN